MICQSETENSVKVPESFVQLIRSCWDLNPDARPTITKLKSQGSKTFSGLKGHSGGRTKLVDKILRRLENYAQDLECEVLRRTADLISERTICDALLAQILPISVVRMLRTGKPVKPEYFEEASILFSDVYEFAEFVLRSSPLEVTRSLMDIESMFDQILGQFDVYKVEAVGDTYMAASGVPVRNGHNHARETCAFALEMRLVFDDFSRTAYLHRRIGIHTGPCAAGVMGYRRPRYCLFGDTINTASRMCSHGEPSKIHLSEATANRIKDSPDFHLAPRGIIAIKGKQEMTTYWLSGPVF